MCSTRREKDPPDVVRIQYFVHELGDGEWSGSDHPNTGILPSTYSQHIPRHSFFEGRSYSSQINHFARQQQLSKMYLHSKSSLIAAFAAILAIATSSPIEISAPEVSQLVSRQTSGPIHRMRICSDDNFAGRCEVVPAAYGICCTFTLHSSKEFTCSRLTFDR
jgi:hypothetical protein